MESDFQNVLVLNEPPAITDEMRAALEKQNSRIVTEFKAKQLEEQAARNWDCFYKRNGTRFFKDR